MCQSTRPIGACRSWCLGSESQRQGSSCSSCLLPHLRMLDFNRNRSYINFHDKKETQLYHTKYTKKLYYKKACPSPEDAEFQPEQVLDKLFRNSTEYPCKSWVSSLRVVKYFGMYKVTDLFDVIPEYLRFLDMTIFFARTRSQQAKKKRRRRRKLSASLELWRFRAWWNSHFGTTHSFSQPIW